LTYLDALPRELVAFIRRQPFTEYATVTAAGAPIDTPTFLFPSPDLTTLDIATSLAYPLKAERARRNPKVGMLIEGGPDEPVISISGQASVRDADLDSNCVRYLVETILTHQLNPQHVDYGLVRQAIWYLARIVVCVTPLRVRWWPSRAALAGPPQEWRASASLAVPPSDPAPSGKLSPAPDWPKPPWRELAENALGRKDFAHLTLVDAEGYPLPMRVDGLGLVADGLRMRAPPNAPWSAGQASLSFDGVEVFIGEARPDGEDLLLRVDRNLPVLPLLDGEVVQPKPEVRAALLVRLDQELARRGKPRPVPPAEPPAPSEGALIRAGLAQP
jgi:hypothetical protein